MDNKRYIIKKLVVADSIEAAIGSEMDFPVISAVQDEHWSLPTDRVEVSGFDVNGQ